MKDPFKVCRVAEVVNMGNQWAIAKASPMHCTPPADEGEGGKGRPCAPSGSRTRKIVWVASPTPARKAEAMKGNVERHSWRTDGERRQGSQEIPLPEVQRFGSLLNLNQSGLLLRAIGW
jgi:hypothetical protein